MKKYVILFICLISFSTAAILGFYFYRQYQVQKYEADRSARIALVSAKIEEIAKHDSKIKFFEIKGDVITGRCAMQNAFGAWSNDVFKARISDGNLGHKLTVLFIYTDGDISYVYDERPENAELQKKIKNLYLKIEELDAEYQSYEAKVNAPLEEVGYSEKARLANKQVKILDEKIKHQEELMQLLPQQKF